MSTTEKTSELTSPVGPQLLILKPPGQKRSRPFPEENSFPVSTFLVIMPVQCSKLTRKRAWITSSAK